MSASGSLAVAEEALPSEREALLSACVECGL